MKQPIKDAIVLSTITNTNVTLTLNSNQAKTLLSLLCSKHMLKENDALASKFMLEEVEAQ